MTVSPDPYFSNPIKLGFAPNAPGGSSLALTLNTSNTWLAIGFTTTRNVTLDTFMLYPTTIVVTGGALTGANHTLSLQADTSGAPSGTSIETKSLASAPVAGTWSSWTGFTTALTADTQYWLVLKNLETLPATQNATWSLITGTSVPYGQNSVAVGGYAGGYNAKYTTDGSTWSSGGGGISPALGWRVGFSDGTYIGVPVKQAAIDSTNTVYSARELGIIFTTPSYWPTISISRLWFHINTSGTPPAGGARFGIWTGSGGSPSNQGYSQILPTANIRNGGWHGSNFDTPITIAANTVTRFTIGAVSGGSAGNDFRSYGYTMENSATTKSLMMFGSIKQTYLNSTFSDTDTVLVPFMAEATNGAEFSFTSGGLMRNPEL